MTEFDLLENEFYKVSVSSLGAECKSLYSKKWNRELLWIPNNSEKQTIWNRTAPLLFPIVGKLKENLYQYQYKTYQMSQHGFARDYEFQLLSKSTNQLSYKLVATGETFKSYPFCFELFVNFKLENNKLTIENIVRNDDRQDIYFSIGAHPAFATENVDNYEIYFSQSENEYFNIESGLVDWKNSKNLSTNKIKLTQDLFKKDALIFKNLNSTYVDLVNTKENQTIRMNHGHTPFYGIWGKGEIPFVCLEPWYGVSDSADHDQEFDHKTGIQKIGIGESFNFSYSIETLL